jgi:hypothetical protein
MKEKLLKRTNRGMMNVVRHVEQIVDALRNNDEAIDNRQDLYDSVDFLMHDLAIIRDRLADDLREKPCVSD